MVLHSPRECQARHIGLVASSFDMGSCGITPLQILSLIILHVTDVKSRNHWNMLATKFTLLILVPVWRPVSVVAPPPLPPPPPGAPPFSAPPPTLRGLFTLSPLGRFCYCSPSWARTDCGTICSQLLSISTSSKICLSLGLRFALPLVFFSRTKHSTQGSSCGRSSCSVIP